MYYIQIVFGWSYSVRQGLVWCRQALSSIESSTVNTAWVELDVGPITLCDSQHAGIPADM